MGVRVNIIWVIVLYGCVRVNIVRVIVLYGCVIVLGLIYKVKS